MEVIEIMEEIAKIKIHNVMGKIHCVRPDKSGLSQCAFIYFKQTMFTIIAHYR